MITLMQRRRTTTMKKGKIDRGVRALGRENTTEMRETERWMADVINLGTIREKEIFTEMILAMESIYDFRIHSIYWAITRDIPGTWCTGRLLAIYRAADMKR